MLPVLLIEFGSNELMLSKFAGMICMNLYVNLVVFLMNDKIVSDFLELNEINHFMLVLVLLLENVVRGISI